MKPPIQYLINSTIFVILFLSGCGSSNTNSTQTSDINRTTQEQNATIYSYEKDIYPILTLNCLRCHGKNGNFSITSKEATYQLLMHTAPRASTGYAHFIEAGSLSKSLIYQKALHLELHGGGEVLHYNSPQATILKSWILQGAKYDLHANVTDPTNGKILASSTNRSACYRCHPSATTQCLRGAMSKQSNIQCQSCHEDMNDR